MTRNETKLDGDRNAELDSSKRRRKAVLEHVREEADERLAEFDEGKTGYQVGEVLDELVKDGYSEANPIEKDDGDEIDIAGTINALNVYKIEAVIEVLQEALEKGREVENGGDH